MVTEMNFLRNRNTLNAQTSLFAKCVINIWNSFTVDFVDFKSMSAFRKYGSIG